MAVTLAAGTSGVSAQPATPASPAAPVIATPSILVDITTGKVLAHQNAFARWYPASLTKLMTAYVTFRALASGQVALKSPVRMTVNAAKEPPSKMGYKPGSIMTLDTALTIMLVKSANDVAVAIGEAIGGTEAGFVQRMNAEAQRLGMFGTHFANPNGLHDPNNYSTARDLAVLVTHIRHEFPQYAHYFATEAIETNPGRKITPNYNILLGRFDGADGMKTGFVCASGFNLAATATRNGRTLLAVVLGASSQQARAIEAARLLGEGFKTDEAGAETLATLRPYGADVAQATDMRAVLCNQQALADRWDGRDVEGKLKLDSPYIHAMAGEPKAVPVGLVVTAPQPKPGAIDISQVPVPQPRPNRIPRAAPAAANQGG
ncbi:D-alanyl-D-alanine carboxypeptidase family protein [Brucella sp. IR073]|uniref:D-alanyl-D-alanine carboxypeptidase family protein n=1 Tax=unclassified Brucella TaxID=2632610 RepID=UPI003B9835F1